MLSSKGYQSLLLFAEVNMCSTPRPKRSMSSSKRQITGSVLANISSEARANFALRANNADERRQQIIRAEQQIQRSKQKQMLKTLPKQKKTAQHLKSWKYWLTQASLKEFIFALLLINKRT